MSTRALVAYYSMSGNTRAIANEIRNATGADLEEIVEPRRRQGIVGVMRAMFDSVTRREPPIFPSTHDPAKYDVLLLGGPVWAGHMAAPVRSYAKRYGSTAPKVAFFCTEGGHGAESAFAELEHLCARNAEATLAVDAAHLAPEAHSNELGRFATSVSATLH